MTLRIATCRCGALQAECTGEPLRVSVCHCLECQRRTGSVFSAQARFALNSVAITGPFRSYQRTGDAGSTLNYQFCGECGATIAYQINTWPDVIAVPLGAFESTQFPPPVYSIYERRKQPWVTIVSEETAHTD